MKAVRFHGFGQPGNVAVCDEVEEPGPLEADEFLIEIVAFPINPADLLLLRGNYASRPALPALLGAEGVGRIIGVGSAVENLVENDWVIPLGRENWVQHKKERAPNVIKVPANMDPLQFAMLKVNPATAHLLLSEYVSLNPGDVVIQNAGNSGVGRALAAIARTRHITVLSVVRGHDAAATIGGNAIALIDDDDLAIRAREAANGAPIRLGIDAVGGSATDRLGQALSDDAAIVNYGMLSGKPCQLRPDDIVFRGICLRGFWLAKALPALEPAKRDALYEELSSMIIAGHLNVPVEHVYDIDEIGEAVAHADRSGRKGKILVQPNGCI